MSKMFANFATPFFCPKINEKLKLQKLTGGRLTKNQLIEIVFFQLIEIFIIS
jgi:hypothetical protein